MEIYEQLLNKFCKVIYKENAIDTYAKIIYATLVDYDDDFFVFEFDDGAQKIISRKIVETLAQTKNKFEK